MSETLKIVMPMAGFGTRLRPHTWSRPKQLVSIAGKSVIAHILNIFESLSDLGNIEYIFIVGYLGEKVEAYMKEEFPHINVKYVYQRKMRGQSHAIYLAKEYLSGPMLVVFADTLIDTDLSWLGDEQSDMVIWVKPVRDPRQYGVAEIDANGLVQRLIEKPKDMHNNLAVVGFYYFKNSEKLITAIEDQIAHDVQLKGEYYLADAINILINQGLQMRTERVGIWLDTGKFETVIETNRYLLEHGHGNGSQSSNIDGCTIIPPVYIHPSSKITESVIGPNVSVGKNCLVQGSVIREAIIEDGAKVSDLILNESIIGQNAQVQGHSKNINIGDNSTVSI